MELSFNQQELNRLSVRHTEVLSQDEIDQLLEAINAPKDEDDDDFGRAEPLANVMREKSKEIQFSFEGLAKLSPEAAQEMLENFKILQSQYAETFYQLANKIDKLMAEVSAAASIKDKRLDRIEKILRGGGDLFDDI
jgi:flagellar motor switch protein FliM